MAEQSITLMFNSKNGEVIGGFPTNEAPPITLKDVNSTIYELNALSSAIDVDEIQ